MRFQLVDPSYCVTTDLTYHKHAIYEGVRSLYPNVSINVHRYYFEIEDESSQIRLDLSFMINLTRNFRKLQIDTKFWACYTKVLAFCRFLGNAHDLDSLKWLR